MSTKLIIKGSSKINGLFWTLPSGENSSEYRKLIGRTAGVITLEPVPGRYQYNFDLPF